MPTVMTYGPYRIYFFSHEPGEPPHVHVDRDDKSAKFWVNPVALARNVGFAPKELRRIQLLVAKHKKSILEIWYGYFGTGSGRKS